MRITADRVAVGSGPAAELPPVTLSFSPDEPGIVAVETDRRPVVLSLVVSGRMTPTSGSVLLDGRRDTGALRTAVALVDTPLVAEPAADLPVELVLREELALAGLPGRRLPALLDQVGAGDFRSAPIRLLPGALRTRLLAETAAARPGVSAVVLTSPERHGTEPADLARIVTDLAARGFAVLTVTTPALRALLSKDLAP